MEKEKISYEGLLSDKVIKVNTSLGKPIKLVFEREPIEAEGEDREQAIIDWLNSIYAAFGIKIEKPR